MRIWADSVRKCVESHLRDVELLLPWVRFSAKDLASMFDSPSGPVPEWETIEPFFHSVPTLAAAPERFAAALRALDRLREDSLSHPSQNRASLARIALLADAIRQSSADTTALIRRLAVIAQTAEQMVRAMDFTFLFDPTRKLLSIGYRVAENSSGSQLLRLAGVGSPTGELYRHCQGRRPVLALVSPGPCPDARGKRFGADFLVGLHLRIPHAGAW